MINHQILLIISFFIPLLNIAFTRLWIDFPKAVNIINKFFSLAFLLSLTRINKNIHSADLTLLKLHSVSIGFHLDKTILSFLFLISLLWIAFTFYSSRFFQLSQIKEENIKLYFASIFTLLCAIIISRSLVTIFIFQIALTIFSHFFAKNFLFKEDQKTGFLFTIFLYLQSFFFFVAIAATYKIIGRIEFYDSLPNLENADSHKIVVLIILYLLGLLLPILFLSFLIEKKINKEPIFIYAFFLLSCGFAAIFIFSKSLILVFGGNLLSDVFTAVDLKIFQWIFLAAIGATSILLAGNNGLKSSFFYLALHQIIFTTFSVFLFSIFNEEKIYIPICSFLLSSSLIFFCISNFILYLTTSDNKDIAGLFYNLKLTSSLLVFAALSLIGIIPVIGILEKFFLLKIIFTKKLLISAAVICVNFLGLGAAFTKIFYHISLENQKKISDEDLVISKNIDLDSSLILSASAVALLSFISMFF